MNFECKTKDFLKACQQVSSAASEKVTVPTLEGILIEVTDGKVTLTAYDLETGAQTSIEATNTEAGKTVVNAKILTDVVKNFQKEEMKFYPDEKENFRYRASSGRLRYKLIGIDADNYPDVPVLTAEGVTVPQKALSALIDRTVWAVADKGTKPTFMALKLDLTKNSLAATGLDGYRLATAKTVVDYTGEDKTFIVPKKTIREMQKILSDEDNVTISMPNSHVIVFRTETGIVFGRLMETDYPDVGSVIPKVSNTTAIVPTTELSTALSHTVTMTGTAGVTPVELTVKGNSIGLYATAANGSVTDEIDASINGDEVVIGFNPKYLMDALKATNSEEAEMSIKSPLEAVVIKPIGSSVESLSIVLPMRIRRGRCES